MQHQFINFLGNTAEIGRVPPCCSQCENSNRNIFLIQIQDMHLYVYLSCPRLKHNQCQIEDVRKDDILKFHGKKPAFFFR